MTPRTLPRPPHFIHAESTFRLDCGDRRPDVNPKLFEALVSGVGYRQSARNQKMGVSALQRKARKLARQVFHGMNVYQGKLQFKQAFLFRLVDVADELFAMAASVSRAHALAKRRDEHSREAVLMADLFCRASRHKVAKLFRDLWNNDDARKYRAGVEVMEGRHAWMEEGALSIQEHHIAIAPPVAAPADESHRAVAGG